MSRKLIAIAQLTLAATCDTCGSGLVNETPAKVRFDALVGS